MPSRITYAEVKWKPCQPNIAPFQLVSPSNIREYVLRPKNNQPKPRALRRPSMLTLVAEPITEMTFRGTCGRGKTNIKIAKNISA